MSMKTSEFSNFVINGLSKGVFNFIIMSAGSPSRIRLSNLIKIFYEATADFLKIRNKFSGSEPRILGIN